MMRLVLSFFRLAPLPALSPNWKPGDPKVVGDATGKTLQMVVAAVSR
jgi:hypothetical protein